jgi:hypothetical protein
MMLLFFNLSFLFLMNGFNHKKQITCTKNKGTKNHDAILKINWWPSIKGA